MSQIENGEIIDNDLSEEEELEDDFILEENKNEIYVRNKYLIEKRNESIINSIINMHEKLDIKDDELFEKIEKCVTYKLIDLSVIKSVLDFVNKANSKEKVKILKEIYSLFVDKKIEIENISKINNLKKLVNIILKINESQIIGNNFNQMKIDIIFKMFNIKDAYIQKIIIKCIGENWDVSSIISFQKKLKYIFPLNIKRMKNQLEKIQLETKEKRLLLDMIGEFIYELNMSKKIKNQDNYNIKEFNQNFKYVYSSSKDDKKYFNDNINITSGVFGETKLFCLKKAHFKNKISKIYQKIEKQKQNNTENHQTQINQDKNNNIKVSSINIKEKINKEIETRIKESYNNKIKEIKEEIKFLVFIDYLFEENIWKDYFNDIILNIFNDNKLLLLKDEIKAIFNEESQHEEIIEIMIILTEKIIDDFIHKIKSEFYKKEYDSNKIKRLEHILIRKCSGSINNKASLEIVKQILSQNILNEEGKFNQDLFLIQEEKNKRAQFVKIFYDSPYPKEIKEIKNIDDFILDNTFKFDINKEPFLLDIQLLYSIKNYTNPNILLFRDFTYKIKDIIIEIFNKSTEDITDIFDTYFFVISQKIFGNIQNYLEIVKPINKKDF